jgi:hypothetical protein
MADHTGNQWKLNGTYFEACNCEAACPCVMMSPPTTGECTVLVAWHIDSGNFGSTKLDGFNVVLAAQVPGHMLQVKWNAAVYLDERASAEQQQALTQIFGGQAGGVPAVLCSFVGKVLGVKAAAIEYRAEGKQRRISIPGMAAAEIEALLGQGEAEVTIQNHPIAVAPGFPAVVAKSKSLTYRDYGYNWEINGKNGFYSAFAYSG